MDYLHLVSVEEADCVQSVATGNYSVPDRKTVTEYSELAMRAAKRMRRSKHKVKTGRAVCRHLLDMINETEESQPAPRTVRHLRGLRYPLDKGIRQTHGLNKNHLLQKENPQNELFQSELMSSQDWTSANDRQFSLTF